MPAWPRPPTGAPRFHFEDVELELDGNKQLRVKPPSFARPIPALDPARRPLKTTNPFAASPQPFEFYPQDKCPVCKNDIATQPNLDFIGHTCGHRGTCVDKRCIREYYGNASEKDFCVPYQGKTPLYCQAPGCGEEIEAWCYVMTRLAANGRKGHMYVRGVPHWNPAADKAIAKAKAKQQKIEEEAVKKEEDAKAEKERKREKEKRKREKEERRKEVIEAIQIWAGVCIPFYGFRVIRDKILSL